MRRRRIRTVNNSVPENKVLVAQLKSGRSDAFEHVVSEYKDKVYSLAYCITRSHPESEEVLQDVFLTIYRKINSLKDPYSFSSWVNTITANFANMKVREKARNKNLLDKVDPAYLVDKNLCPLVEPSDEALGNLLHTEAHSVISKAVSELPQKYQSVIVLKDLNNYSLQKTSDILNISVAAVKSRLHRARKELKKHLKHYFFEGAK